MGANAQASAAFMGHQYKLAASRLVRAAAMLDRQEALPALPTHSLACLVWQVRAAAMLDKEDTLWLILQVSPHRLAD